MTMGDDSPRQEAAAPPAEGRTLAEWVTLATSLVVILGIVFLISWLEFYGAEEPPHITVDVDLERLYEEGGHFYLPVVIANGGDATVEDVIVEATLSTGSGEPETGQITVPFLAGGERTFGAFVFTSDPTKGELVIRPTSYKVP